MCGSLFMPLSNMTEEQVSLQQLQECGVWTVQTRPRVCRFHLNFLLVYIYSLYYFRLCRSLFVYQQFKLVLLDPLCDNPPSAVDPWPSQHAAAATAEPGLASLRGCVHSRGVDEISCKFSECLEKTRASFLMEVPISNIVKTTAKFR